MRWQLANSQPTDSSRLVDDHFHRLNDSYWLALARCRVRPMTSFVVFLVPLSLAGGDTLPLDLPSSTHRQRTTINEVWHFLTLLFFFSVIRWCESSERQELYKTQKWQVGPVISPDSFNQFSSFFLFVLKFPTRLIATDKRPTHAHSLRMETDEWTIEWMNTIQ